MVGQHWKGYLSLYLFLSLFVFSMFVSVYFVCIEASGWPTLERVFVFINLSRPQAINPHHSLSEWTHTGKITLRNNKRLWSNQVAAAKTWWLVNSGVCKNLVDAGVLVFVTKTIWLRFSQTKRGRLSHSLKDILKSLLWSKLVVVAKTCWLVNCGVCKNLVGSMSLSPSNLIHILQKAGRFRDPCLCH